MRNDSGRRRRIGGPPKRDPKPGERVALSLRLSPDLKRRLDAAAEQSGRSQSQEAEIRLEHSFTREHLLVDALSLAYGPQAAGILMLLGLTMGPAAYAVLDRQGHTRHAAWFREWPDDPAAREAGILAGILALALLRPAGRVKSVSEAPTVWRWPLTIVAAAHTGLAKNTNTFPFDGSSSWSDARTIRTLLGPAIRKDLDLYAELATPLKDGRPANVEEIKRAYHSLIKTLRRHLGGDTEDPNP